MSGFATFLRKAMQFDMFGRHVDMAKNPRGRKNHAMTGQIHIPTIRPPGAGWQPIPHSVKGGFRRRSGTKWEYWYPDGNHGAHAAPREPEPAPAAVEAQPASVDYRRAAGPELRELAAGGDKAAAAEIARRQARRTAGEAKPASPEAPADAPEPEPKAADVAKAVEAVKAEAVKQIDHAADNPVDTTVKHDEFGEHVWGSRKDTATSTGSTAPKPAGGATKAEVFGDFTIHDHIAKGGTIGAWHLKQWVAGMVAAKAPPGHDEHYRAGCSMVARTLDRCLTVADVRVAVDELGDWGIQRRKYGEPPPTGDYIKVGVGYDRDNSGGISTLWQKRTSGVQKASLGKRLLGVIAGQSAGYRTATSEARAMEHRGTDAEAYIKAHATSRGFSLADAKSIQQPIREGGRTIPGVTDGPVTGAAVAEHFGGIKNIQYGDWMSHEDRDLHLKGAAGAMADLADILGIPDATVSLNGKLALGFGARGNGRGVAHYEAGDQIINLTKFRGGGSLAHEWGHFMDNAIGGFGDKFATGAMPSANRHAMPQKTLEAFEALTSAIRNSEFHADAQALDEGKKRVYWSDSAEMFARTFESWAQDRLVGDGRANTYLVHGTHGEGHPTGVMRKVMEVRPRPPGAPTAREAEKAARDTLARVIPEMSAKAKQSMTFWGWTDAMVEKAVAKSPEAKAAVAAYWDARRAERPTVKMVDGKPVTREAQPYASGEDRERLLDAMGKFIDAAREDGLLTKLMKAFLGGGTPHGFASFLRQAVAR